jgi:nucleoside 2-deoxyribosyltransferase
MAAGCEKDPIAGHARVESARPVAYIAGPDVFHPDAAEIGARKQEICSKYRILGLLPPQKVYGVTGRRRAHSLFERCVDQMDVADLIIVNMTPFRGTSMDVGSAVELGYMYGLGKPVFGYTTDAADYLSRVSPGVRPLRKIAGRWLRLPIFDEEGCAIENFRLSDNLMCDGPVWDHRHAIVSPRSGTRSLDPAMRAFEACVRQVDRWNRSGRPMTTRRSRRAQAR